MKKRLFALVLIALLLCVLVCPAFASSNGDTIVYRTRTGECYHTGSCAYLRSSKIEITLADAVARGLRPCSRCSPPRYLEETAAKSEPEPTSAPTRSSSRASTSMQSMTPVGSQIDLSEFKEKQKQAQAEFEANKKQLEEYKKYEKYTESIKPPAKTNSVSSVGLNIICVLFGIWSFIFLCHYFYEKIRNILERFRRL